MKLTSADTRILVGITGYVVSLVVLILSGFTWYDPNATIATALITLSSGLLSAGIWKKDKVNSNS